jgi:predicted Zn-dependent protease
MSIRRIVPIAEADWSIAPPADWVVAREPDWSFVAAEEHGVAFLLIDEQHHVGTQAVEQRTVRRLLTHAAVQALGQVQFDFDPAAQRLRIHELAVWRQDADGQWKMRSVAQRENFLIRQREQQLEQQMLNGRASVVALLEDLRAGDAIDMAWTLEPHDPLPGLRFTTFYAFFWTVPVSRMFFTLHLDPAAPVLWRMHADGDPKLPAHESAPQRETWSVEHPPVSIAEPNVPPGDWAFPVIDVSGWKDWGEVASFVATLWSEALAEAGDAVAADAARLRVEGNVAASIAAAIRFVQEEVRYLAVDFGHGSGMLPNGAGTVLRRRFGDCKDKTVLLTALLRALGCEAWPLLVGPGWRKAIARVQPSTAAFSHAIVTFVVEGKRYFVDPTFVGQGGDLEHRVAPAYGYGLEIRDGVRELTVLPEPPPAEIALTETFNLDRKQRDGSVEQVLRATGWLADEVRAALVRGGAAAFFKMRGEVLQKHFPALVISESPGEVQDDLAANVIELRSRHALPTWGPGGEKPPEMFRYGGHGLFLAVEYLEGPETRRQPWALRHPMRVHHRVVVRGSCVRKTKAEKHRFSGPGFTYRCDVAARRREMTFDYRWETTQAEVSAQEWPAYARERAKALDRAGANVVTQPFWSFKRKPALIATAFAVIMAIRVIALITGAPMTTPKIPVAVNQERFERDMRAATEAVRRGDYVTAEPMLETLRPYADGSVEFHQMRAETAIQTGRLDRAEESLSEARRLAGGTVVNDLLQALLRARRGDVAAAQRILEKVLEQSPDEPRALLLLARMKEQLGDVSAAQALWEKLLALQPKNAEALLRSALILWRTGDRDRADAVIDSAVRAQPAPSAALESALAEYYSNTGRVGEALESAQRASRLAPDDIGAAFREVMLLLRSGRQAEAERLARTLTRRFPGHPAAWNALASAAATGDDNATAASAFREWLRLAPRDPQAHAGYGLFLYKTGRNVEARGILAQAAHDFPGEGLVWLNYSTVLEALGERAASLEARRKGESLLGPEQRASLGR